MKLKTTLLDDIAKKIIEIWDRGEQETFRYISHTTNYPETHHIDMEETYNGEEKKKDEDEAEATAEKPWENYKVSCKDCKSCCGI